MHAYISKVAAQRSVMMDMIDLYFRADLLGGKSAYATNIEFTEFDPSQIGEVVPVPLSLRVEAAQTLMDQLWNCGIRPTEGAGSAGAMRQAEDHIATLKQECERLYALLKGEGDAHSVGV